VKWDREAIFDVATNGIAALAFVGLMLFASASFFETPSVRLTLPNGQNAIASMGFTAEAADGHLVDVDTSLITGGTRILRFHQTLASINKGKWSFEPGWSKEKLGAELVRVAEEHHQAFKRLGETDG